MPRLKIQNFGGVVPRTSSTMLKDNEAQVARNAKLYRGELRPWRGSTAVNATVAAAAKAIFRLRNTSLNQSAWLTWGTEVDAVLSPNADTSDFRVYYTGDGAPKKTNWALATATGTGSFPRQWRNMGVVRPTAAPGLALVSPGTSLGTESRTYVYTNVSTFGSITEESAPSPASALLDVPAGRNVTVTLPAFTQPAGYTITSRRIYRSLSSGSSASYLYVGQVTFANNTAQTFTDNLLAASLGEALSTAGWVEPPAGLKGLTTMANGMLAGFVDNTVYFCEPYFPHAWPVAYAQIVPHRIVGLASIGNSLVVMTQGEPYIMTGVTPGSISVEKIPLPQPCVSKKSIATDGYGVVYAGPDGLVGIGNSVRNVISDSLFRRDEWKEYAPETIVGGIYDGKYFGGFASALHGTEAMILSRDDYPALSFIDVNVRCLFVDKQESALYYLDDTDNKIYQLDADGLNPLQYEWRSKRFVLPQATTWSAAKIDVDVLQMVDNTTYLAARTRIADANAALMSQPLLGALNTRPLNVGRINGSILAEFPDIASFFSAQLNLYGERGEFVASIPITSFDVVRIPAFKSREITLDVSGNLNIRSVSLATTVGELRE